MKVISINKLEPGMVLGAPVEDANGRLLLAAGETVQGEFIPVLQKRGICTVTIEEPVDRNSSLDLSEALVKAVDEAVLHRHAQLNCLFEPYGGQEPYDTLKSIIEDHIEQGLLDWDIGSEA